MTADYGSIEGRAEGQVEIGARRDRRPSILDRGGDNSFNQLVKSVSRNIDTDIEGDGDEVNDDKKSTVFQTVFNSINILVGIGILSLPLLFKLSGWILGIISLLLCALVTQYTATLLARCYMVDHSLRSYNQLGNRLIGPQYNFIILILFNMDLFGAILLLIILFADSFHIILGVRKLYLKIAINVVLFGLNFLSLRLLSILSLVGIICTNCVIVVAIICGLYKHTAPGSILDPMFSLGSLYPSGFRNFLISVSLMMSNFGGHAVLPEFINDMKHPAKAAKSFRISFGFTFLMDLVVGIICFLMFGDTIEDEFTKNLMTVEGYPQWCNFAITLSIGLLPISKLPLISRPIMVYLETVFNVPDSNHTAKTLIKLCLCVTFALLSICISNFGKMMLFLGALICFTICVTLPLLFYISICGKTLCWQSLWTLRAAVVISLFFTVAGTVATVL